jgi:hypothetical protein
MPTIATFDEIIDHKLDEVVRIASINLKMSLETAHILFCETKKFLWLQAELRRETQTKVGDLPRGIFMFDALKPIDEMWHQFILCTRSYSQFCEKFLGGYLHHEPISVVQLYGGDHLPITVRQDLALQCRYIARKLGQSTLAYWYQDLAKQYPM